MRWIEVSGKRSSVSSAAELCGISWWASDPLAHRVDPYLFWAELTRFTTYEGQGDGFLRAAFELKEGNTGKIFLAWLDSLGGNPPLVLQGHWRQSLEAEQTRYFTARVRIASLASSGVLDHIECMKVGFVGGASHGQTYTSSGDTDELLKTRKAQREARSPLVVAPGGAAPVESAPGSCIIGIIDFGCAFAHEHFCTLSDGVSPTWTTRVTHFWEQQCDPPDLVGPWRKCRDFGYGREATKAGLDGVIAKACMDLKHPVGKVGNAAVESKCYSLAALPELLEVGDPPSAHGTKVMDVATGSGFAHPGSAPANDAASKADIMFVQLPEGAVRDLSGGWLSVYVLDAVAYLVDRAQGRPLVINLSFGSFAGSHDGLSLLEKALASYTSDKVTIVLAAGNTIGQAIHAQADLAPNGSAAMTWYVPDGDATQNFMEIWYRSEIDGARANPPSLKISLKHPDITAELSLAGAGGGELRVPGLGPDPNSNSVPVAGMVHLPQTTSGGGDGMALLCLGPTMTPGLDLPDWPRRAPHGRWTIEVTNESDANVEVHAWVERDEPGLVPAAQAPQSVIEPVLGVQSFRVNTDCTLSGQCGPDTVVVVGSYRLNATASLALDTAFGPARRPGLRKGPDLVAPGAQDIRGIECGLPVAANLTGQTVFASGTSLAAPWVARQRVNEICAAKSGVVVGKPGAVLPSRLLDRGGACDPKSGRGHVLANGSMAAGLP